MSVVVEEMADSVTATTIPGSKGERTRRALLSVAMKLFGEKGFRGTSIRDIASQAGSNVAAVNYHFGTKENLYREVFRRNQPAIRERGLAAVREMVERHRGRPAVEAVLEAFVQAVAESREPVEARSFRRLIYRELVEPRLDPHFLLKEVLEPLQKGLGEAISAACPGLSATEINLCVHSFLAQMSHLRSMEAYFGALDSEELPSLVSDRAIRHIVKFTGAGIKALQRKNK